MKVNGIKLQGTRIVSLFVNISEETAVEFKFRPLSSDDSDSFEKVMPKPQAPKVVKPGGEVLYNTDDKNFKINIENWAKYKFHWEFLRSISATEDLEWSKVKMDEPATWELWEAEVTEMFGKNCVGVFYNKYIEANMITEESMEKARLRFLAGRVQKLAELSSQTSEQQSTESGEPAKDSESVPQE